MYTVETVVIGGKTYAIVTGQMAGASSLYTIQMIDVSYPTNIVEKDSVLVNGPAERHFLGLDTFTIGASTYAILSTSISGGVRIYDISDPENIVSKNTMSDNAALMLKGARDVEIFTIGASTYAIVAAYLDKGVQIIDISDPENIVAKNAFSFDSVVLTHPEDVEIFTIGASTYAIVTAYGGGTGVQIIDISDPENIVAKDTMVDTGSLVLQQAKDVNVFTIGASTYAIITSSNDNGVQIIDISDPENIVSKDALVYDETLELRYSDGIDTFTSGSSTYAIVANGGYTSGGVQTLDISDPENIVALDAETDGNNGFDMLTSAKDVDTFTIGASTYAIVTAQESGGGVQIIKLLTTGEGLVVSKTITQSLSESIALTDSFTKTVGVSLSESITMADSNSIGKTVTQSLIRGITTTNSQSI